MSSFIDQIKWNQDGLLPVVTVDANSRRVLMQAWVNSEARFQEDQLFIGLDQGANYGKKENSPGTHRE
jgi:phosphoribosyl-AMP cyclohydrolase